MPKPSVLVKQRVEFVRISGCAVGATGILLLTLFTRGTIADEPYSPDRCPSQEATIAAVSTLLARSSILPEDLQQVDIEDLGERYVISVKGRSREYTDITRDCTKRARVAAVFVAMTLSPPDIGLPESTEEPGAKRRDSAPALGSSAALPPSIVAPVHKQPSPFVARSRQWSPRVELGAKAELPAQCYDVGISWSGHLRLGLSSPNWGVTMGVDAPARSTFEVQPIRVQLARFTADLSLRVSGDLGQTRTNLDIGPLISLVQLRRLDQLDSNLVARWQTGFRFGANVIVLAGAISPFVGTDVEVIPVPVSIAVKPDGVIGHLSVVWLGFTAGLSLGSH